MLLSFDQPRVSFFLGKMFKYLFPFMLFIFVNTPDTRLLSNRPSFLSSNMEPDVRATEIKKMILKKKCIYIYISKYNSVNICKKIKSVYIYI